MIIGAIDAGHERAPVRRACRAVARRDPEGEDGRAAGSLSRRQHQRGGQRCATCRDDGPVQDPKAARAAVQATRTELAKTEADLEQRQQQLTQSRQDRARTLAALNDDIQNRRSERQSLEADRQRLEQLLKEVQQAIASIPAPNESSPFKSRRDKLPWPAKGRVVSNYGAMYADGKLRRNGILMNTAEEAEIKAVHYGRVVFANWLRGFGLITIIDHGDGYMTLYGHSSSLFTTPGDWVRPGETIALAGRTGGTEDPAVYFEVRSNGKPVNPRSWLGKP